MSDVEPRRTYGGTEICYTVIIKERVQVIHRVMVAVIS